MALLCNENEKVTFLSKKKKIKSFHVTFSKGHTLDNVTGKLESPADPRHPCRVSACEGYDFPSWKGFAQRIIFKTSTAIMLL